MIKPFKTETNNYTFYGAIFGLLFPIGATITESIVVYGSLTWVNVLKVQSENILIWVIDSAPFWLGLFARLGGIRQDKLLRQNALIEDEVRKKTADIEKALNESKRANHAKSEFLARMSHELRTPMNSILGFTQLLQMDSQNPLASYQRENMERVISAGNHLLELINEVLDLSKIEFGEMKLSIEKIDIVPIIDNVISISKPLAEEKGISLNYLKVPEGKYFLKVDQLRFRQIFLNLISNAIKYNKLEGSVIISFEELESGKLRLGVEDTGSGISGDMKEKVFKPFERFDKDSEIIEGTGIGLAISKKLVELMGGAISYESHIGKGSTFYIDMPLPENQTVLSEIEVDVKPLDEPIIAKGFGKILYIDDVSANIELVKQLFAHRSEFKIISALNAIDGIGIARNEKPDLILMDIHMQELDGIEAFKQLKIDQNTKDIPVIALTADAMDRNIQKAMEMGFKDYITKPIDVSKLLMAVDEVFA